MGDQQVPDRCHIEAWAPPVPGVAEVFHARIVDYAYPPHCHDTWTVLIVDSGAIRYDIDRRHRGATDRTVSVLPPGVVHDGRPAPGVPGFRKRNLYLDPGFLPGELIGSAVDQTAIQDAGLRAALGGLHDSLAAGEESLDAEARLALIGERIASHLTEGRHPVPEPESGVAARLRELLDEHIVDAIRLEQAAQLLERSVPHLVRSFTRRYGVSPHAYVVGRRVEAARRHLLRGMPPAEVAAAVGFYDQAHLTRHFKRHTSVTPGRYAGGHRRLLPDRPNGIASEALAGAGSTPESVLRAGRAKRTTGRVAVLAGNPSPASVPGAEPVPEHGPDGHAEGSARLAGMRPVGELDRRRPLSRGPGTPT